MPNQPAAASKLLQLVQLLLLRLRMRTSQLQKQQQQRSAGSMKQTQAA
jgi:hypothetical protein